MSNDKFRLVCTGIVTNQGDVLIGKKEEDEDHPVGGEWHFPGGHLDEDEEVEEAVEREVEEETGLEVEVHQILDSYRGRDDMVRVTYHCESESRDAEAKDDLEKVEWVDPENLEEKLGEFDSSYIRRDKVSKFLEKLQKMPAF